MPQEQKMSVGKKTEYLSVEEYLRLEEKAAVRHEYVDGQIFEMSGATQRHSIIITNLVAKLDAFLEGTPCNVLSQGFKVRVASANCFYYPDIVISCGESDDESVYTENPSLIVEVLSPSTASIDRREKRLNYAQIPSLTQYLIVHQRHKRVELYTRRENGDWDLQQFLSGESFCLASLPNGGLTLSVDTVYKNTTTTGGAYTVQEEAEEYMLSADEAEVLDW